jgi:hypothetical protein
MAWCILERSRGGKPGALIRRSLSCSFAVFSLAIVLSIGASAQAPVAARAQAQKLPASSKTAIPAAEFSRMVGLFSEEEGSFFSDNFVSNETGYLHVLGKLKQLGVAGGAYIGVGPEQNFTYIAKIRPQIAFIVDIRREAIIQHLMYKAIFQMAANRMQFLSLLFSKPLDGKDAPSPDASIDRMVDYFSTAPTRDKAYAENLAAIRKTIEKDFEIPLSANDIQLLQRVYGSFKEGNLTISFRFAGARGPFGYGGFPMLKDLLLATDLDGNLGNFLASTEDYDFVRDLQRKNRIIPVVGDFAGKKALAVVGDYLKENGYTVSAYYTSNVEEFLFGDEVFNAFVENVKRLPVDEHSVFIRAMRTSASHPAHVPGHRMTTVLQKIQVFLNDYEMGLLPDYRSLVGTDFIAGNQP